MAGDFMSEAEAKEKGLNRSFNSYTLRGRFNWVAVTYGSIFGLIALYKIKKMLFPPPEKPYVRSSSPNRGQQGPGSPPQTRASRNCGCRS
ncbi:hypothetical protein EGW08_021554 [Elysia chlorotica]|uniref:Uncharacterized protein n=1 Tax=Elysia chlorotica TaxID=188477 RepID=A0A433SNB3_ELYCH|nr:hypothetical protein EGW08_021554 [Elysia chlorotica]